ncbi:MAG: hypothetical protein MUC50_02460 [Myxococcota bacterium]|jgi:hypothetical protein|nr:hypothetical protein [Myxococcota bacterium]
MRFDNLIIRLSAVLGPQWLQAYALIDLQAGVDVDEFRFELPRRLKYHHETEKYVGGVPGDLFVGFFCQGQTELFEEVGRIKAMKEVREVKDWAIANFPVSQPELTKLDWQIAKCLRGGAQKTAQAIADELHADAGSVAQHLDSLKKLPLAFSIEPPNEKAWSFAEIHIDFQGTSFGERVEDLRKIGKPFGATGSRRQGAIMVEPKSVEEFTQMIMATARIPGVRVADFAFCEDMIWSQPWLDAFIDERIAEMA